MGEIPKPEPDRGIARPANIPRGSASELTWSYMNVLALKGVDLRLLGNHTAAKDTVAVIEDSGLAGS